MMTTPRQIIQIRFDPHHTDGYIALCNDGTAWYGTQKVTRNKDGEYKPSSAYWIRLPDIPQEESDEN